MSILSDQDKKLLTEVSASKSPLFSRRTTLALQTLVERLHGELEGSHFAVNSMVVAGFGMVSLDELKNDERLTGNLRDNCLQLRVNYDANKAMRAAMEKVQITTDKAA